MVEDSVSFFLQDEVLKLKYKHRIFKRLAGQRLKKLEEHCIHHFNLIIKYLVPMTMSILWITSLMEGPFMDH